MFDPLGQEDDKMMRDGFIRIPFKPRGSQAEALLANVVGWTQEKRDRTRSKSSLAQCGVKDPTKTGLAQSSKMSGQALHAWSLAGGSVAICSAASAPTYSRWFQLKSDQLPRAVAKPTSLYNNI